MRIEELDIARENNNHILDMVEFLLQHLDETGNIDVPDTLKFIENYAGSNRRILDGLCRELKKKGKL